MNSFNIKSIIYAPPIKLIEIKTLDQQQQPHGTHEILTPTASITGRKQMNATTSEQQLSKSLNEQDHLNHQQQQQQTAVGNNGATTTTTTTSTATTSRRTTSLLNIFTSNSQGN